MRYNLSLYSCSSEAPKILHRWQGYMEDLGEDNSTCIKLIIFGQTVTSEFVVCVAFAGSLLFLCLSYFPSFSSVVSPLVLVVSTVPSGSVSQLAATQQDSDILLTWKEIPLVDRRGFLQGYNIYISNGSQLTRLGKCYMYLIKELFKTHVIHLINIFITLNGHFVIP